jgi:hypothetical protein
MILYTTPPLLILRQPPGHGGSEGRTEMTPVKDSHTRIKLLTLASGYGRYIKSHDRRTRPGTCVRWGLAITITFCRCNIKF